VDVLLLVCRLILAAVLAVAAVAKLADRPGTRRSLEGFGVPSAAVAYLAVAVPGVELLVAAALVPVATAWAGALAATALLLGFAGAVALALARGVEADCHCFGRLSSEKVGWSTLARNLLLVGLAAFVAIAGSDDAGASVPLWVGGVALAAGLALNFAFMFELMKQHGRLLAQLEELRPAASGPPTAPALGAPAPSFALPDLSGQVVSLDELRAGGRDLLLVFSDPKCGACDPLLPEIGRRQRDPGSDPLVVLVSLGNPEDIRAKVSDHGIELVLLADDFEIARSFGVGGLPGAIALDAGGNVSGAPAHGTSEVLPLLLEGAPDVLRLVEVNGG
jgi:methylamine dehydrogenase accessory protein MauD